MNQPSNSSDHNNETQPRFNRDTRPPSTAAPRRIPLKFAANKSTATYTLMGITIFVFALQMISVQLTGADLPIMVGAKINDAIAHGQLWRLITPMFLHGDFIHIAFNMYALHIIGSRLERHYGHWRFLALYLLSGFGGNVISLMFTEASSLGASTATFGLLAAQGIFFYHNRKIYGPAVRQALNGIITVLVINLMIGFSNRIDNWGHIGGLLGGIIFAWLAGPLLDVCGDYPNQLICDQRKSSDVVQAVVITFTFFAVLTAGAIYLMN